MARLCWAVAGINALVAILANSKNKIGQILTNSPALIFLQTLGRLTFVAIPAVQCPKRDYILKRQITHLGGNSSQLMARNNGPLGGKSS